MMSEDPRREAVATVDAILSALSSGVIMVDRQGSIVHANRSAGQMLGYRPRDLVGRRLGDLRGELEAMTWPTARGEILLLPTGRKGELAFPEHTVFGFSSRTVETEDGERLGTVVSFSDITASKAEQRAEQHSRRLADIGRVVSSIAHEIRNPVFAIASLVQVLATEDAVAKDPDLQQMAGKILEEVRRIGRLIEDLLGFSRERELQRQRLDVVELVRTVIDDLRRAGIGGGEDLSSVPVVLDVGATLQRQPTWSLDPEAMRQIMSNVLRNAWQAVRATGRDRDPEAGVEIRLDQKGGWLDVEIIDRGIGIPSDKVPRIFDAFYTTRRRGTGLGLAIVDRLVRQHGGTIALESEFKVGTTVSMRFPP
jgi:PAS domain S-box-containing protein